MKGIDSRLEASLKLAEDLGYSDIDKLSIAEKLLGFYNSKWKNQEAARTLQRINPSLQSVENSFKKSAGKDFTGAAPLIYLNAARLKLHDNDFEAALKNCDRGIALASGQPNANTMLAPLEREKGLALKKLGRLKEAEKYLAASLTKSKALYGASGHNTIATMIELIETYLLDNNYHKADQLSVAAIRDLESTSIAKNFSRVKQFRETIKRHDKRL